MLTQILYSSWDNALDILSEGLEFNSFYQHYFYQNIRIRKKFPVEFEKKTIF